MVECLFISTRPLFPHQNPQLSDASDLSLGPPQPSEPLTLSPSPASVCLPSQEANKPSWFNPKFYYRKANKENKMGISILSHGYGYLWPLLFLC